MSITIKDINAVTSLYTSKKEISKLSPFKLNLENARRIKDIGSIKAMIESWTSHTSDIDHGFCLVADSISKICETAKLNDHDYYVIEKALYESFVVNNIADNKTLFSLSRTFCSKSNSNINVKGIFESLSEDIKKYDKIQKILSNNIKLESKIDFDKQLKSVNESFKDIIYNLCECVDETYQIPLYRKFGVCAENFLYSLNKRGFKINDEELLKTVTEYFVLVSETHLEKKEIKNTLSKLELYTEADIASVSNLFFPKSNKNKNTEPEYVGEFSHLLIEANIPASKNKVAISNILADFIKSSDKNIKATMTKIYAKPLNDILEECPSLLSIFRKAVFIGGTIAINPLLGVIVGLTDFFIENDINRKQSEKYLKHLQSEKKKIQTKLDKCEDEEKIKAYKEYISTLDKNIIKVTNYSHDLMSEKELDDAYDSNPLEEMAKILYYGYLVENGEVMVRENIPNVLHLAKEKFKKETENLVSADRAASRTIDNSLSAFTRNIEKALTNDRREAVVKGQLLPSASKTIKTAIAVGALWAVNPAIAVVSSLGALAISKKCTQRERQLILDEIEIHLKIVDKKLQQAEINNDDKSIEDLYKLQMRLKREQKRIKYGIKVYYDQNPQ